MTESAGAGCVDDTIEMVDAEVEKIFLADLPKKAACSEIITFGK